MITLSSKSIYGVHSLYELALHYGKDPVSIKTVAEAQDVPEDYLRQILLILKKAELVKSRRGTTGGYVLARDPSTITIAEVIEALEGPMELSTVLTNDPVLSSYWERWGEDCKRVFKATFQELIDEKKKRDGNIVYHI